MPPQLAISSAALLLIANTAALQMSLATPKKLAVLGGSGYVGREVCRRAVTRGYEVP